MSKFIPQKDKPKLDPKKLLKKLKMKYGAPLQEITDQCLAEAKLNGFVTLETEAKRQALLDKIKDEEKYYK